MIKYNPEGATESEQLTIEMSAPNKFQNEYQTLDRLGEGSFGVVYKCQSLRLDKKLVAVKKTK